MVFHVENDACLTSPKRERGSPGSFVPCLRFGLVERGLSDILCLVVLLACCPSATLAQDAPANQPTTQSTEKNADPLPSLDDMLGIDDQAAAGDTQHERELERKLTAQEAAEALTQALQLMDDSALRLAGPEGGDLVTQRLQEDIIRKLDTIIESAKQNQGQSGSSSASSQAQQGQQNQPAQQRSGGQQANNRGENTGQTNAPPPQDAALSPQTLMDSAAWGALPDRLRDALQQGMSESFSSAYRRLTESYYKRLAEQAEGEK
ncbi:MAG: hypothetical protein H6810_09390 [Phycisphaeraceae bacterium]|nr:MAG: hypothetical protein H6810_09390 [Phycisphaeraceae bacterium]